MIYEPTRDHMQSLLLRIFKNHTDSVDDPHVHEISLDQLDEDEMNEYLRLSIGFFETPEEISLFKTLQGLQAWLSTGDSIDKEIVAEQFRNCVFESIKDEMQEFINTKFNEYKEEKRVERLYDEGFTPKVDQQTGEVFWVKR